MKGTELGIHQTRTRRPAAPGVRGLGADAHLCCAVRRALRTRGRAACSALELGLDMKPRRLSGVVSRGWFGEQEGSWEGPCRQRGWLTERKGRYPVERHQARPLVLVPGEEKAEPAVLRILCPSGGTAAGMLPRQSLAWSQRVILLPLALAQGVGACGVEGARGWVSSGPSVMHTKCPRCPTPLPGFPEARPAFLSVIRSSVCCAACRRDRDKGRVDAIQWGQSVNKQWTRSVWGL